MAEEGESVERGIWDMTLITHKKVNNMLSVFSHLHCLPMHMRQHGETPVHKQNHICPLFSEVHQVALRGDYGIKSLPRVLVLDNITPDALFRLGV